MTTGRINQVSHQSRRVGFLVVLRVSTTTTSPPTLRTCTCLSALADLQIPPPDSSARFLQTPHLRAPQPKQPNSPRCSPPRPSTRPVSCAPAAALSAATSALPPTPRHRPRLASLPCLPAAPLDGSGPSVNKSCPPSGSTAPHSTTLPTNNHTPLVDQRYLADSSPRNLHTV